MVKFLHDVMYPRTLDGAVRDRGGGGSSAPRAGDVLVSRRTATVSYEVVVVSEASLTEEAPFREAVQIAADAAKSRAVDAWLTDDHTHFLKLPGRR